MANLPDIAGGGNKIFKNISNSPVEKFFRWAIIGGLAFGAMKFFNSAIAPTLWAFCTNAIGLLPLIAILFFVGLFLVMYPQTIYNTFLGLAHNLAKFFVKIMPWSHIEVYMLQVQKAIRTAETKKNSTDAKIVKYKRQNEKDKEEIKDLLDTAAAAKKRIQSVGDQFDMLMRSNSAKAEAKANGVKKNEPMLAFLQKQSGIFDSLIKNYTQWVEITQYKLDCLKTEWETVRDLEDTIKDINKFMNSGTEQAMNFKTALNQIEDETCNALATVQNFETKVLPEITRMDVQNDADAQSGLQLLDSYTTNGSIFLDVSDNKKGEYVSYTEVKGNNSNEFASLLK